MYREKKSDRQRVRETDRHTNIRKRSRMDPTAVCAEHSNCSDCSSDLQRTCHVTTCHAHSWPNWVVSANTTDTFKVRLNKFWYNQNIVYDFRAQLQGTGSRSEVLCE